MGNEGLAGLLSILRGLALGKGEHGACLLYPVHRIASSRTR